MLTRVLCRPGAAGACDSGAAEGDKAGAEAAAEAGQGSGRAEAEAGEGWMLPHTPLP